MTMNNLVYLTDKSRNLLKKRRQQLNLSARQVSASLNIYLDFISRVERSSISFPKEKIIELLELYRIEEKDIELNDTPPEIKEIFIEPKVIVNIEPIVIIKTFKKTLTKQDSQENYHIPEKWNYDMDI